MVNIFGTELNFFVIPSPHLTEAALFSAFITCHLEDTKSLSGPLIFSSIAENVSHCRPKDQKTEFTHLK